MISSQRKLLVLGSGGREHSLCWKLAQSEQVESIVCAPGNGGTATCEKTRNEVLSVMDFDAIVAFVKTNDIDTVIVGPENPLAEGLVDRLGSEQIRVFGPEKAAAQLEASKAFSKDFMQRHHLPTARFEVATSAEAATQICKDNDWARVIKADGLALGKGVFVCDTFDECLSALNTIFTDNAFGNAGAQVVIEERLVGPEASLFLFCDGKTVKPCILSQDYKRRFEENKGPNTGGMGTYAPVEWAKPYWDKITQSVIQPLEKALASEQFTYKGLLFVGLMFSAQGESLEPYILEFNCRFGDPETQSILPLLDSDLLPVMDACIDGTLDAQILRWSSQHAVCVVATAENYPASGSKNQPIKLPASQDNAVVFHAGTCLNESGDVVSNGGRVLNVVGFGVSKAGAQAAAYELLKNVSFSDMAYRRDIGMVYDRVDTGVLVP